MHEAARISVAPQTVQSMQPSAHSHHPQHSHAPAPRTQAYPPPVPSQRHEPAPAFSSRRAPASVPAERVSPVSQRIPVRSSQYPAFEQGHEQVWDIPAYQRKNQ